VLERARDEDLSSLRDRAPQIDRSQPHRQPLSRFCIRGFWRTLGRHLVRAHRHRDSAVLGLAFLSYITRLFRDELGLSFVVPIATPRLYRGGPSRRSRTECLDYTLSRFTVMRRSCFTTCSCPGRGVHLPERDCQRQLPRVALAYARELSVAVRFS